MQINWKDHLISLIVVIVGISIAFYLESWREHRKIEKQERTYLLELEHSLAQDSILLDTLIDINAFQRKSLDRFLRTDPVPSDCVSYFVYNVFYNLPFSPQKAAYESMKASGGIQSLKNFQLTSRIMELYEQDYQGLAQWDDAVDEHVRDFYRPFIINRLQLTFRGEVDSTMLQSQDFRSIVVPYRAFHRGKSDYYIETLQRISQTKALIHEYLH